MCTRWLGIHRSGQPTDATCFAYAAVKPDQISLVQMFHIDIIFDSNHLVIPDIDYIVQMYG